MFTDKLGDCFENDFRSVAEGLSARLADLHDRHLVGMAERSSKLEQQVQALVLENARLNAELEQVIGPAHIVLGVARSEGSAVPKNANYIHNVLSNQVHCKHVEDLQVSLSASSAHSIPSEGTTIQGLQCELQPFWTEMRKVSIKSVHSASRANLRGTPAHAADRRTDQTASPQFIAVSPVAKRRIWWELFGAILILFDIVAIPLQAFGAHLDHFPIWLLAGKAVYWTTEVPFSFLVGYYENGVLELRPRLTANRYLKSWFIPDMTLLALEWTLIVMQATVNHTEERLALFSAGRVLRLLRFARLLRLLKLHRFIGKLLESVRSQYVLTFLHVSGILALIIVVNHFVACLWYALGTVDFETHTWVQTNFDSSDSNFYKYATSAHWALTQFTPASMEVVPRNALERIYNIIVLIMGMVAFSTFIGSITQAMTRLRNLTGAKDEQFDQLRRYLGDNNVSRKLATRAWRYFEQGPTVQQHRVMWKDVELFREIPEVLKMDLQHEVFTPTLVRHPFFFKCEEQNTAAMRAVCHHALTELFFRRDQDVFSVGQAADRMYFIVDGVLQYKIGSISTQPSAESADHMCVHEVPSGFWISEPALWVKWLHLGTAVSQQGSVVCSLSSPSMQQVMKNYADLVPACCAYADCLLDYLGCLGTGVSDMMCDYQALGHMAASSFQGPISRTSRRRVTSGVGVGSILKRTLSLISASSDDGRSRPRMSNPACSIFNSEAHSEPGRNSRGST